MPFALFLRAPYFCCELALRPTVAILLAGALGCYSSVAGAASYQVEITSLSKVSPVLAFDLTDGGGNSVNQAHITSFATDGQITTSQMTGSVEGALTSSLTLSGGAFFSEFLQETQSESEITFHIDISQILPPIGSAPDAFAFYLLDPTKNVSLLTTSDDTLTDALFKIEVTSDDVELKVFSPLTTSEYKWAVTPTTSVPELPTVAYLLIGGLFGVIALTPLHRRPKDKLARHLALLAAIFPITTNATATNVTGLVTVSRGGFYYNRSTNTFDQLIMIKANATLIGPLLFEIKLSSNTITLQNKAGTTDDSLPYIEFPIVTKILSKDQTTSVIAKFVDGSRAGISYAFKLLTLDTVVPRVGRIVSYSPPELPADPFSALPINPATGRHVLVQSPQGSLEYDPTLRSPRTALSRCAGWIMQCFQPGARDMDDCARSASICKTATPWNESASCCPSQCYENYNKLRLAGSDDWASFSHAYLFDGNCIPQFNGIGK